MFTALINEGERREREKEREVGDVGVKSIPCYKKRKIVQLIL